MSISASNSPSQFPVNGLANCLTLFLFYFSIGSIKSVEPKSFQGVYVAGDIILGGLFPVHEKSKYNDVPCSHKVYNRGIQRLEAMLYAIDTINADQNLLKDVKLGVNIRDTCSRDTFALNQSLEFIRSSLNTFDVNQYECSNGGGVPRLKFNTTGPILGVIGGSYSSVSIQVANLLRLFRIPQISPASTAKILSDKSRFDLFARTVPPDTFQAIALVDIVKKFNWTYVSTIASEGSYGESGIDVFQREAEKRNICIAIAEKVPSDANDAKFNEVVSNLLKKPNAKAVVLFTRAEDARGILKAARRLLKKADASNSSQINPQKFYWLASDGWGKQGQVVSGIEDFSVGAITVELESKRIPEFDEYMNTLTPEDNERNHWFRDYWEDLFECDIDHRSGSNEILNRKRRSIPKHPPAVLSNFNDPILLSNPSSDEVLERWRRQDDDNGGGEEIEKPRSRHRRRKLCNPQLRMSDLPNYEQDSKIQFVIDAVYAFAHALDALKADICPTWKGVCPAMIRYDGGEFYKKYLLKVDFEDMAKSTVKFDEKGDGLARYTIYNYQKNPIDNTFDYKVVGKWYNKLKMHESDVLFDSTAPKDVVEVPNSVCSFPCKRGEIMIMNTGDTCCWICQKCQDFEFMLDKFSCQDCGPGNWPNENKTACFELPMNYMRWESVFAIVPVCIACVGIVLTVTTIGIFIKFADTPLVRASGRELSYVILAGLLLCYLNTFILLAKPGVIVCMLQRFSVGMGFSFVYGALLTKTNRISRIFHSASQSARRPSYISPRSQLIITSILASVQFMGTLVWIVVTFPDAERVYPHRHEVLLKCNINDSSFLFSQVYNMILITVCTYYAIMTRKVPENFNEAKFIGFTMYTTCIIWLAFVPIYFGTGNSFEIQITTLCISISLSAYTTLFCLFSPKVYIIVFQPEKNVRKLTMNSGAQKKTATSLLSNAACSTALATNRMQQPGNGGPNGNPIQNQNNGGSATVTKAQVNLVKISPILVEKTAESSPAQIETILPPQPLPKQQPQLLVQQQHPVQQPQKSPSTNNLGSPDLGKEPISTGLPIPIASSPTTSRGSSNSSGLKKSSPASLSQQTSIEVTQEPEIDQKPGKRVSPDQLNIKESDDVTRYEVINVNNENAEPDMASNLTSTSVYVAMSSSPGPRSPYTEEEQDEEEEDDNLSLTSPGTPCSQCLREEQESTAHHSNSGQRKFFNGDHFVDTEQQSSEECYSIESGSLCCHSSCCDERHLVTRKLTTAEMPRGKRISLSEEAAAKLGQNGQGIDGTSNGGGDSSPRQLITYVTPGMETVPLEMCQDIPDVLI